MPAAVSFARLRPDEWSATLSCVRGEKAAFPWENVQLRFMNDSPSAAISGVLVGGNLSLWATMAGTPYFTRGEQKILFFEDIGEPPYRIDRMVTQLLQSGAFTGAAAIILGDFTNCDDEDSQYLKPLPQGEDPRKILENMESREKVSLRRVFTREEALAEIFGIVAQRLKIPVASGLPVGHGPNYSPLPLGAEYELDARGTLRLVNWSWLQQTT
jgi:muramoyltetrapeptide carboxypeptidase